MSDQLIREIDELKEEIAKIRLREVGQWVYPNDSAWAGSAGAALTSTSFDGDAFSTTAKTVIDLSAEFSVPAGVRAVQVWTGIRDSGSAGTDCLLALGPTNTAGAGISVDCSGLANDEWERNSFIVPCDSNGDIYYQIVASGASTMDVYIRIWGYMY
jgi:hypothetical protein